MKAMLYHGEPNGPSLTVLAALLAKQYPAERTYIDLAAAERHELPCAGQPEIAMSVEGEGPVLVVEGEGLSDSVFIACYLDEMGVGPALRPADPYERWEMMSWCRQLIERTAPAAACLGCHACPPRPDRTRLARIASADLRARWEEAITGEVAEDRLADCRVKIGQAVARIEARLDGREWLMGGFSIADLESYAWLAGMTGIVPEAFTGQERCTAWLARTRAHPAVAQALALGRAAHPERVWAPGPEINRWG